MAKQKPTDLMAASYFELCDRRDAVNAKVEPLQEQLDAANAAEEKYRLEALRIKGEIDKLRGGAAWIELKKDIGRLAHALGKIPPRPAKQ